MTDRNTEPGQHLYWHQASITRERRSALLKQAPCIIWFTGLSGAGKSTIANQLETLLHARGRHTMLLDGDNLRNGLNRDLGFSEADRAENVRRVGEVARLMTDAGLIVIVAVISPSRQERQAARTAAVPGEFIEVFVDTPIAECARRDPKGLYRKAYAGEIPNFTGVGSPYETPENPEVHIRTLEQSPAVAVAEILKLIEQRRD